MAFDARTEERGPPSCHKTCPPRVEWSRQTEREAFPSLHHKLGTLPSAGPRRKRCPEPATITGAGAAPGRERSPLAAGQRLPRFSDLTLHPQPTPSSSGFSTPGGRRFRCTPEARKSIGYPRFESDESVAGESNVPQPVRRMQGAHSGPPPRYGSGLLLLRQGADTPLGSPARELDPRVLLGSTQPPIVWLKSERPGRWGMAALEWRLVRRPRRSNRPREPALGILNQQASRMA